MRITDCLEKRKKDLENPHQSVPVSHESRDAGAPGSRAKRDPHAATPCAFARRPVQAHIGSRLGSHRRSGARPNTSPRWFRGAKRKAETRPPSDVSVTWRAELPPVHHGSSPPPACCVPERAEARELARPTLPRPCSTPTTDPHQSSPADRPHTHQQTLLARTVSQTRVHVGRHA